MWTSQHLLWSLRLAKDFVLYWRHHYRGNIWNLSFFLLSSSVQVFQANHMRYDIMTVFLLQVPTCNRVSHAAWNTQRTIWGLISLFFLCRILLMHISWRISLPLCFFSIHTTDSFFSLSFLLNLALVLKTLPLERRFKTFAVTVAQQLFFWSACVVLLERFTEDTEKEQSESIWQSSLRKILLQIPWYIPANLCLGFPHPCYSRESCVSIHQSKVWIVQYNYCIVHISE